MKRLFVIVVIAIVIFVFVLFVEGSLAVGSQERVTLSTGSQCMSTEIHCWAEKLSMLEEGSTYVRTRMIDRFVFLLSSIEEKVHGNEKEISNACAKAVRLMREAGLTNEEATYLKIMEYAARLIDEQPPYSMSVDELFKVY